MIAYILHIENLTSLKRIGSDLIKKVFEVALKYDATDVIIQEASYNKLAIIELYVNDNCVLWNHKVRAW